MVGKKPGFLWTATPDPCFSGTTLGDAVWNETPEADDGLLSLETCTFVTIGAGLSEPGEGESCCMIRHPISPPATKAAATSNQKLAGMRLAGCWSRSQASMFSRPLACRARLNASALSTSKRCANSGKVTL